MYELWGGGSPFTIVGDGSKALRDRSGQTVRLLGISGELLHRLRHEEQFSDTIVAWVSCTDEPAWAAECLQKLKSSGGEPLASLVHSEQIFKDNKQTHFRNLKTKYPKLEFSDMLFFDNEMGNIRSVSKLGVCCIYCPDGVTHDVWEEGLATFAKGCQ